MSTNISRQKRDALLDKINQIKNYISAAPQDENTANLLAYIGELTKEINGKKYGLVFEEHREKIDELLEENAPVLVEQEDLFIDNGGEMNFLIEGDNLAALKLLEKTHKGKIDVIYIDPPYNTGNKNDEDGEGFIYDDEFVDITDMYIHSKWLSFMKNRLFEACKLLKKNGVIFISIGREENATLRLLCDEIFGAYNLLGQVVRQTKTTSFRGNYFSPRVDYILVYAVKETELNRFMDVTNEEDYTKTETAGIYAGEKYKDDTAFYLSTLETRPNQRYWIQCPDGELVIPPGKTFPQLLKDSEKVLPENGDGVWRWECEQYKNKKYYIVCKKSNRSPLINQQGEQAHWNIYTKSFFCEKKDDGNIPIEILTEFINRGGTSELKKLKLNFTFPKPLALIEYLLKITNKTKNITILDFFAGSGTTGHAVMKLNAEDGGNRKFILCTNNENNICQDVTYQRLKTVITGKRKDGSEYDESYKASLKYFKIDYLPIKDKMYYEYADELLEHVKELVELENAIDFNSNKSVAIVLDDDDLDDFVENIADYPECKTLYMGHDVLTSYQQEQIIKAHGITINIVPNYYYRDLAN